MRCEHCGRPAAKDLIVCRRCWRMFNDEDAAMQAAQEKP